MPHSASDLPETQVARDMRATEGAIVRPDFQDHLMAETAVESVRKQGGAWSRSVDVRDGHCSWADL